jgi:limonene-1,2-epoxide hydrolase
MSSISKLDERQDCCESAMDAAVHIRLHSLDGPGPVGRAKSRLVTDNAAEQVVNAFVAAIENKDEEAAMAFVSEDVVYDNVPFGSTTGKAPMAKFLAPMFNNKGPVEFEIVRQTAVGNTVINERIDKFHAGFFEVNDGLITSWRDYFDNDMFMKAMND